MVKITEQGSTGEPQEGERLRNKAVRGHTGSWRIVLSTVITSIQAVAREIAKTGVAERAQGLGSCRW